MSEFLHMGGYAAYVWSSYAIAFIVLLPTILIPLRENKRLMKHLKGKYKRDKALAKQQQEQQDNK